MTEIALHMPAFAAAAADLAGRMGSGVVRFFDVVAAAGRARVEFEQLARMSDSDLTAHGLTRETALRGVFERNFD
jgi:hypothetical protein